MTERYKHLFEQLNNKNEKAFVPFVTLCDPDFDLSLEIIRTLVNSGADALELGFPFSDPIADGPVIQKASIRALENGATVSKCFELLAKVREESPDIPIGLLLYSNLVVSNGIDAFYSKCNQSGVDSVLVADVPSVEAEPFIASAKQHNVQPIFIATPNADDKTIKSVSKISEGYTYLLSRAGVTGTNVKAEMPLENILASLKSFNAPPPLLGFGISTPEQVKEAIKSDLGGVISGSAVVKIVENNLDNKDQMLSELEIFVKQMKAATREN